MCERGEEASCICKRERVREAERGESVSVRDVQSVRSAQMGAARELQYEPTSYVCFLAKKRARDGEFSIELTSKVIIVNASDARLGRDDQAALATHTHTHPDLTPTGVQADGHHAHAATLERPARARASATREAEHFFATSD